MIKTAIMNINETAINADLEPISTYDDYETTRPDTRFPKELWDIKEEFKPVKSTLANLLDEKQSLEQIIKEKNLANQKHIEKLNLIKTKYNKKMTNHTSNLEHMNAVMLASLQEKERDVLQYQNNEKKLALDNLTQIKQDQLEDYKNRYNYIYDNCYNLLDQISNILKENKIHIDDKSQMQTIYDNGYKYEDIQEQIINSEEYIQQVIKDGDKISLAKDKINSMDDQTVRKAGLGLALTTMVAAPMAVIGAGGALAYTFKASYDAQVKVQQQVTKLLGLQELLENKLNGLDHMPQPDLETLDKEYQQRLEEIDNATKTGLEQIEDERADWRNKYKNLCEEDVQSQYKREQETELREMQGRIFESNQMYERKIKLSQARFTQSKNEFMKKNELPNMKKTTYIDMFNKTSILNNILQNYTELGNFIALEYNHLKETIERNKKLGLEISEAKIEYDKKLYREEYIPIKVKIYNLENNIITEGQYPHTEVNKEDIVSYEKGEITLDEIRIETKPVEECEDLGSTPEYNKSQIKNKKYIESLHAQWCRLEDELFQYDNNNLHVGQLITENKYKTLNLKEQVNVGNWNNGSVIMVYKNLKEEKILINLVKYLVHQSINNLHPSALQVNIINPTSDTIFNDLSINTTHDNGRKTPKYVDVYEPADIENLSKSIENIMKERQYGDLAGGKEIKEVIQTKRIEGSKTPKWVINVMHRMDVTHKLNNLSENSLTSGIINIILLDYKSMVTEEDPEKRRDPNEPPKYEIDKAAKDLLAKVDNLVMIGETKNETSANILFYNKKELEYRECYFQMISETILKDRTKYYEERFHKALKTNTITTGSEFIMQMTGGKYWQESAHEEIKVHFGYHDGDKTKTTPVMFDESSKPHGVIAGTTGGGKSVTLQLLANTMKAMYPPSELNVFYYDFKKVEVALHANPYKWPNARALAGASTAEYFVSLLKKLTKMMDVRYSLMEKAGVNKLSNYREFLANRRCLILKELYEELNITYDDSGKKMGKHKNMMESYLQIEPTINSLPQGENKDRLQNMKNDLDKIIIPPRLVVIIDEVQEGFRIDDETSDTLKHSLEILAKVARAAGLHMILLTQDPGGVIPESVFKLLVNRACTVAPPDVSNTVLRNDFCARPENQFLGFLGVNTSPDGNEESNMQFVVPYAKEEDAMLYSKITEDMANKGHMLQKPVPVVLFNQDSEFTFEDLDKFINNYKEIQTAELVLGEKVEYQEQQKPSTIQLLKDVQQGICYLSSSKVNKINFFKTIMRTIQKMNYSSVVFFGKQKDEDYNVEQQVIRPLAKEQMFKHRQTGELYTDRVQEEELKQIFNQLNESELLEVTEEEYPVKYFAYEHYGKPAPSYNPDNLPDHSFTGTLKQQLQFAIGRQRYRRDENLKYEPVFLIAIDPEKDSGVFTERAWRDKEFISMVNEAMEWGVYLITITSDYMGIAEREWHRYIVAREPGTDAQTDKVLKKLKEPFSAVKDVVTLSNSYTLKMPVEAGMGGDNHLYGIE